MKNHCKECSNPFEGEGLLCSICQELADHSEIYRTDTAINEWVEEFRRLSESIVDLDGLDKRVLENAMLHYPDDQLGDLLQQMRDFVDICEREFGNA